MYRRTLSILALVVLLVSLVIVVPAQAQPPAPDEPTGPTLKLDGKPLPAGVKLKEKDQPNPKALQKLFERQRLLDAGKVAEAAAYATAGQDRVLVILVEFGGPDVITWNPGDTWDPLGIVDPNEIVYDDDGNPIPGDCSNIITQTTTFTYVGPLHNEIPRPISADDRSGDSIWTEDFSPDWFKAFMFGDGVTFHYTRTDGSLVHEDFTGKSVKHYFLDMSSGTYSIEGDVFGWLRLPHSTQWYGADTCPGRRTLYTAQVASSGAIPGAGSARTLVMDALDALNAISNTIPGFDWANYDLDGDGVIDRLWIVHSGYGEEDSTTLLNRTPYGESSIWSHSSSVSPAYEVAPGIKAGPYIIMPENGGIGVFAHEYAHNLGAIDLYAYTGGETSAGFWALQADDWTGYPIGYQPPAVDPYHLDMWGWLNPFIIDDPTQVYEVTIGQTSNFPGGPGVYRGVKIELPSSFRDLEVQPQGMYQWWGGKNNLANARMTLKTPLAIPAEGATLEFDLAYDIEEEWDFLWVQASADNGDTWTTLTNENMICTHDPEWIGGEYDFPDDLCAAGIAGFSGHNADFPDWGHETIDLSAFAGQNIIFRFWYMTDWATTGAGPFLDNVVVKSGETVLFSDNAEGEDDNWTYQAPWQLNDGTIEITHNYYLQWRNVSSTGGYDSALGDPRWRFGPANTGLLVWYNNNSYTDNEIINYLTDDYGFGPKGVMLVVDSHPEPYRDPYWQANGYNNEGGNITSRMQMRDATFSLNDTVPFTVKPPYAYQETQFTGRPAAPSFHDAIGYYPGAELVRRGPGYAANDAKWITKAWDASVALPAGGHYGIRAPGYGASEVLRFDCERYPGGRLACYGFPAGLGYNGGTGNPGDNLVQYGWHVEIVSQTDMTATLKIWNSMQQVYADLTPRDAQVSLGKTIDYEFDATNVGGAVKLFACVPLDPTKASYVAAMGGAVPLGSLCPTAAAALAAGQSLQQSAAAPGAPVLSIGWLQDLGTTQSGGFGFKLLAKATGTYTAIAHLFDLTDGSEWSEQVMATPVQISGRVVLPIVLKLGD